MDVYVVHTLVWQLILVNRFGQVSVNRKFPILASRPNRASCAGREGYK